MRWTIPKVYTKRFRVSGVPLDNGTEFVNQTLRRYYENVGISHETSVARTPQQNGVVERRNRTLVEAARTILIYAKAPLFLWAKAVTPTYGGSDVDVNVGGLVFSCRVVVLKRNWFLSEDLAKLKAKADVSIFIGYAPAKKAYQIYKRGIRNVPPNGVFGNEVYGSDSEGFGMNPSSNEFRLCNSDEWRSGNHGGRVIIRGYGGGGDMVVRHGLKGCLDHRIIRSSPILPPLL
ncbi:retrovirus-related pol polyprotein from transposon TNT 1-94 [Tanacetum coccineum]|uniref:Retrovirus-related pol polyprotein from transposon TNT 1-94 n=1 Tax=Tanacetum coccineum TaxID=301880 RepID=A0ABQ5AIB1_9ASTR